MLDGNEPAGAEPWKRVCVGAFEGFSKWNFGFLAVPMKKFYSAPPISTDAVEMGWVAPLQRFA